MILQQYYLQVNLRSVVVGEVFVLGVEVLHHLHHLKRLLLLSRGEALQRGVVQPVDVVGALADADLYAPSASESTFIANRYAFCHPLLMQLFANAS